MRPSHSSPNNGRPLTCKRRISTPNACHDVLSLAAVICVNVEQYVLYLGLLHLDLFKPAENMNYLTVKIEWFFPNRVVGMVGPYVKVSFRKREHIFQHIFSHLYVLVPNSYTVVHYVTTDKRDCVTFERNCWVLPSSLNERYLALAQLDQHWNMVVCTVTLI